ncbi:molybdopterin-dependent oxidoreductase [Fodinicurvata sp. EGI_FJ10296]|uniref:molybdopterin-dependent oxidoreductase n=1 Tax=Fodinicurvata sp. EGI_FJ10296 TaxID=3231908 RepID=UPI0034558A6F
MTVRTTTSLCHWGAFDATVDDGRLTAARPWSEPNAGAETSRAEASGGADPDMIGAWPDMVYSPQRIDRPHARRSFLKHRHKAGGDGRGRTDADNEMVPISWETALSIVADELTRVYDDHGPASVFGGSYGWSSAGRFHHARTQIRRFLAAAGGYTDQIGNYSWGAAHAILPHVLGSADAVAVAGAATSWESITRETDTVVAFGGLNPKNWRVTSGGAGNHQMPRYLDQARAAGVEFVILSPFAQDVPDGIDAQWIAPRPNSDTAIMLALARQAVVDGRADRSFLARHVEGHERFIAYLAGDTDGVEKSLEWAAGISDLPVATLQQLWHKIRRGRVMLTASWSLQRADHGEQPYWALIALAAMLGQIGQPGGGFSFGYGSVNGVGASARRGYIPSMRDLPNPAKSGIPAAAFTDAFLNPGRETAFNGRALVYPDIRLVYWAGGNPFHHGQDLFRVEQAWRRPETVIVHEPWWTATARRADIVLPATTSAERNDIGGSSRDPFVFFMPKLIEPVGAARDDFDILRDLAGHLGCRSTFDEGRDEDAWLRHLWSRTQDQGARDGVSVPDFETFRDAGYWRVPAQDRPDVLLSEFRADPDAHALATPSGRIELYSTRIEGFGYDDCPPHPAWMAPGEWLGTADADELHLITNQPAKQLHSQLYQARKSDAPAKVDINAADAEARGIGDGDTVRLWNARGACLATARVGDQLRRGVVVMPTGAWFDPDPDEHGLERNGNPNALTADRTTSSLGRACTALSALVRVAPYSNNHNKG